MDLCTNLPRLDLRSTLFHHSAPFDARKASLRPRIRPIPHPSPLQIRSSMEAISGKASPLSASSAAQSSVAETSTSVEDVESLFSDTKEEDLQRRGRKKSSSGASSVSSGVKLENISKSYEGVAVLRDVSWEVKKGEKVGLVGVNGAGKTTQMKIICGEEGPDSGNVIRAKPDMKIAFLSQEFEVSLSRTVREEFMHAFKEEMEVAGKLEKVQKAIEGSVDDLELMGRLLDEFDLLQKRAQAADLNQVDSKISRLMPELGFGPEDSDRLVASYSSGWQMRISLGKILLQLIVY